MRMMESNHVGFLCQITGGWARFQSDKSLETPAAEEVLQLVGMQLAATYIGHHQSKVAKWVDL